MWFNEDAFGCTKFDSSNNCTACDNANGFFMASESPFVCCPLGYYYDINKLSCSNDFTGKASNIINCKFYTTQLISVPVANTLDINCRKPTAEEISLVDCTNGYFTNFRCCPDGSFSFGAGKNCIPILATLGTKYSLCNKIDDDNNCIECIDNANYISNEQ